MLSSSVCNEVFEESISDYHKWDKIDQPISNPYKEGDIRRILFQKNWIDTVQWHLEDEIRRPDIDPVEALALKRRIDASNQERTDMVEVIDHIILQQIVQVSANDAAPVNTETPAWAIDRLSILALKIYHMQAETHRTDADDQHRADSSQKLGVLLLQRMDLSESIDQLLTDIRNGKKRMKLYKQMKMYNDPAFNPVLYRNER